ncbi:MAG: sulfotransferase [Chloroflexota bacterium]|nr:sulfotransferase [Chloroflexota bacterium]
MGGCSRSGTTLLGSILGAHTSCVCPPESHFKVSVLRSSRTADGGIDVARALRLIRIHWRFKLWGIDVHPAEAPTGSYVELIDWLVDEYARRRGMAAHVWVDHTPENINYAPLLLKLFPQARIVHLVRDGRAVANSILPLDWGPNTVIRAAPWWRAHVREGLALEERLPPSQILRVRFEDIVHAPEETIRRLCSGLDLPFEPRMLHADGFQPPDYTAGQHKMIGQRPNPGRAARWESELTPRQVEIFESLAGDLLRELGYPLLYGPQARPPTLRERGAAALKELARANVNAVRWLIRSYPLWLSYDFLRALPDTWRSYHKVAIEGPIDLSGQA